MSNNSIVHISYSQLWKLTGLTGCELEAGNIDPKHSRKLFVNKLNLTSEGTLAYFFASNG